MERKDVFFYKQFQKDANTKIDKTISVIIACPDFVLNTKHQVTRKMGHLQNCLYLYSLYAIQLFLYVHGIS